jgi:Ca2+-binding EF-hand superfamily protein
LQAACENGDKASVKRLKQNLREFHNHYKSLLYKINTGTSPSELPLHLAEEPEAVSDDSYDSEDESMFSLTHDKEDNTHMQRALVMASDPLLASTEELTEQHKGSTDLSEVILRKTRKKLESQSYIGPERKSLIDVFVRADKDHNGTLDYGEFRRLIRRLVKMSDHDCAVLMCYFDIDKTGVVNYREFLHWMIKGVDEDVMRKRERVIQKAAAKHPRALRSKNLQREATKLPHRSDILAPHRRAHRRVSAKRRWRSAKDATAASLETSK